METIKKWGKWIIGGLMFVVALASVIFARRPKPEPITDTYKGDRLEEQVTLAPIEEQHKQIAETLKPQPPTVSKDMQSAINAWKTAGD